MPDSREGAVTAMGISESEGCRRVLVWGLSDNRAGTEMVIYNYVRSLPGIAFDFLCYEEPSSFADLFEDGRNRWFAIPVKISHPLANARALRAFMAEHGHEYEALWFNMNDASNIDALIWAKRCGIPRRIAHMHSSRIPSRLVTRVFSRLNQRTLDKVVTDRWACSQAAGRFQFGEGAYRVVPNLVNAQGCAFSEEARASVRASYGLEGAFVIGTVGRLSPEKNQAHLMQLMPRLLEERPQTRLLLVGEGPCAEGLRQEAERRGVASAVAWAGRQRDVRAFLSAMDAFALPSLFEGLPLSLLEAQYNGLPCVVSEGVDDEAFISSGVDQVALGDPGAWVEALLGAERAAGSLDVAKAARFDLAQAASTAPELFGA